MTLWPIFNKAGIIGFKGEKYKVGPTCCVLGCTKFADHAHHVFSRALMAGDFNWIRLHDGTDVGNLVPICHVHHDQITDNQAKIWIESPENGKPYVWYWDDLDSFHPNQPLKWQPPQIPKVEKPEKPVASQELKDELGVENRRSRPGSAAHLAEPWTNELKVPRCEACGRPWRARVDQNARPMEEKKLRGTFGISIPIEERENGFEVLEDLIEACRGKLEEYGLEWGHGHKNRYHLICTVLGLFSLHADSIMSNE